LHLSAAARLPSPAKKGKDESERAVFPFAILRAVLALLALWVLHQPLRACEEGHSFRDSQQTLWGSQRDRMDDAEARTSPLFYKAALPKPVRVTPSFLGTRWPPLMLPLHAFIGGGVLQSL